MLLWTWGYYRDVRAGRSLLNDDYHASQNCLASEHRLPLYASSTPWGTGYYQATYCDPTHEDSLLRTTTEMLEDKDRENRALRMELFNARADHWATLTRFAPAVQAGFMDMRDLYPVRSGLPECMEWCDVGGITPPRGPRLPPFVGPRPHPSPYGPQAPQDRLFPDDHVQLPGHGGDFYEDYYGDV